MLHALSLSLAQLGDRRILAVLAKSLALTLLLFAGLGGLLWWALHGAAAALAGWLGGVTGAAMVATVATVAVMLLAGWLLFRAVAVLVIGLFADEVVAAVERRHYPDAFRAARPVPFPRAAAMGLASAARALVVNGALLPLYLLLLVTGVGTAVLFFLANAALLARDLGDMVAIRHLPPPALSAWRSGTTLRRFALGACVTALFLVPVLNLLAPVLGAAMATHLFHRGRQA
jgi:CysZ protein